MYLPETIRRDTLGVHRLIVGNRWHAMVTVAQPLIFELPWRRDARGYRVIDSIEGVRELWRRWEREQMPGKVDRASDRRVRDARDPWPDHWPHPSRLGGWLERWAAKGGVSGGGLIWPESDEAESFLAPRDIDDDDDGRALAERLLATVGDTPSDYSDVLEFTNRYGLLWEDGPLTVEEFRAIRNNLHLLAMQGDSFRGKIGRLERHEYEGLARDTADRHSRHAPRFRMELREQRGRRGGLVPQMVPEDLYSLITLQVTEGVYSGSARWRRCDHCGSLMLVGTGTGRGGKAKFCTRSCKYKHADSKRTRRPAIARQEQQASYAMEVCPYCPESDQRPKRNANHCGRQSCKQKHYRAKQKANA